MHSAEMPWQVVCLSVCLSVCQSVCLSVRHTPVLCAKFFYSTILVLTFSIPNRMAIFRRGPPNGGVECNGYDFSTNISFISELMQDRAIVTMEGEYHESALKLSNGTILNDLQ